MSASIDDLSKAELRIAVLVARGCSNREIAEEVYVSVNTVKTHMGRILTKLGMRSRTELCSALMLDARFRDMVASPVSAMELPSLRFPGRGVS